MSPGRASGTGPETRAATGAGEGSLTRRVAAALGVRANQAQIVRFMAVGGSGYVVNLAVFSLAFGLGGLNHFVASVIAFLVAVSNNFTWNRLWTFRAAAATGRPGEQAPRFLAVSLAGLAVNLAALGLMVDLAGLPEIPSQAAAVALALPVNFLGNRLWTFAPKHG
ncbi:GtrA family protein [Thermoleophilia bacterium SCSIO 60948]|nr:GtrA family protein [Thermoleophilia bacterium SCSIO 60948]